MTARAYDIMRELPAIFGTVAGIDAANGRRRAILLTTGAMGLGAMPRAMATGAGAESRNQIGWVIAGGLLLGTFLTLFVIPVTYTYLARRHQAIPAIDEDSEAGETYLPAE